MPHISTQQLLGLPVVTESGRTLGRVRALEIDVDTHAVLRYIVQQRTLQALIGRGDLIVHATQVVRITVEALVVHEGTIPQETGGKKRIVPLEQPTVPVLGRRHSS